MSYYNPSENDVMAALNAASGDMLTASRSSRSDLICYWQGTNNVRRSSLIARARDIILSWDPRSYNLARDAPAVLMNVIRDHRSSKKSPPGSGDEGRKDPRNGGGGKRRRDHRLGRDDSDGIFEMSP